MLRFEMYQETQGILNSIKNDGKPRDWRWRLIGKNGEPIANGGEGYRNKDDCRKGIALVMSTDTATPVIEV